VTPETTKWVKADKDLLETSQMSIPDEFKTFVVYFILEALLAMIVIALLSFAIIYFIWQSFCSKKTEEESELKMEDELNIKNNHVEDIEDGIHYLG
jgi:C4-dicarboxylate transporter